MSKCNILVHMYYLKVTHPLEYTFMPWTLTPRYISGIFSSNLELQFPVTKTLAAVTLGVMCQLLVKRNKKYSWWGKHKEAKAFKGLKSGFSWIAWFQKQPPLLCNFRPRLIVDLKGAMLKWFVALNYLQSDFTLYNLLIFFCLLLSSTFSKSFPNLQGQY